MKPKFKFEVYPNLGKWRYRIRAVNGRIVAQGEGYNSKRAVMETIKRMKNHLLYAPVELRPNHR